MDTTWFSWMKQGYDAWDINPSVQIVPSVPQGSGATINSMQQILAAWLTASSEFPSIANTKPIVGYPYTSSNEVPEPTTLFLALLAMTAVLLRVRHE